MTSSNAMSRTKIYLCALASLVYLSSFSVLTVRAQAPLLDAPANSPATIPSESTASETTTIVPPSGETNLPNLFSDVPSLGSNGFVPVENETVIEQGARTVVSDSDAQLQLDVQSPIDEGPWIPLEQMPNPQPSAAPNAKPQPEPQPRIDPQMVKYLRMLRAKIDKCLVLYQRQHENVANRSPWGIMHAMIGFGSKTQVYAGGRKQYAVSWLCWNGPCRNMRLFRLVDGRINGEEGPGYQGHSGQFLAMLAQLNVKSSSPMRVSGKNFTVANLIQTEMLTCKAGSELTFKLIGLCHYLRSDVEWMSLDRQKWDIQRLIREEMDQPISGSACGGTHRMMGFSYAVRTRQERGEPIDGEWLRAKQYVEDYHEYTLSLQNPDGSFSTNFFEGRGNSPNIDDKIRTSGHILEWLAYSLPQSQLYDRRMIAAADYLATLMLQNYKKEWEIGPKGHALRALRLYSERAIGAPAVPSQVETLSSNVRTR